MKQTNDKRKWKLSIIDLAGKVFGRLTVLSISHLDKHSKAKWLCLCECGNQKVIGSNNLKRGKTKSCGCQRIDSNKKFKKIDGYCTSKDETIKSLYGVWQAMKARCFNPNNKAYSRYGGRGITVCDQWLKFDPFLKWALDNGYKKELHLDREKNEGNYTPENCRFVARKVNNNNKRNNHYIEYKGEKHTLSEWSEILKISKKVLSDRIVRDKWTIERAFTTPVRKKGS